MSERDGSLLHHKSPQAALPSNEEQGLAHLPSVNSAGVKQSPGTKVEKISHNKVKHCQGRQKAWEKISVVPRNYPPYPLPTHPCLHQKMWKDTVPERSESMEMRCKEPNEGHHTKPASCGTEGQDREAAHCFHAEVEV